LFFNRAVLVIMIIYNVNEGNELEMYEVITLLLESCVASNPDDASLVIVEIVWKELNLRHE
jgi:hypothetical protein